MTSCLAYLPHHTLSENTSRGQKKKKHTLLDGPKIPPPPLPLPGPQAPIGRAATQSERTTRGTSARVVRLSTSRCVDFHLLCCFQNSCLLSKHKCFGTKSDRLGGGAPPVRTQIKLCSGRPSCAWITVSRIRCPERCI